MHFKTITKITGWLILLLGVAQLIPMGVAWAYQEPGWSSFLMSAGISVVAGGGMALVFRKEKEINERDGFFIVTLSWVFATLFGALPYLLTGTTASFTDAVFETISGFTTTGASILTNYETIGRGVFLWRSLTQWFGGMGIIVLALVILPALGVGGMQLYKREVPGPTSEKLTPRLRDTAKVLWSVYLLFTALEVLCLVGLGMSWFEAVNHAMTTLSTGGFSTRLDSVAGFNSPAIEWVLIFFMFVGGMNFSLHYRLLAKPGQRMGFLKDDEWRWYTLGIIAFAIPIALILILNKGYAPFKALTESVFSVVSIVTTTGFVSDDYMKWGGFAQIALLYLMIAGGCAGSTGGGVKWVRISLVIKYIRVEMLRLIHPKLVMQVRLSNQPVNAEILSKIFGFLFLYLSTLAIATLLVALDGHSLMTSLGAAASALGNVGPGLDLVGPVETYAPLSAYVKWVLILSMLLGRLELMTVFILFLPQMWRWKAV